MKLHHLALQNFRGFESFQVDFNERLTVLVGENASGKTSVLEAASVALAGFVSQLPLKRGRDLQLDDMRHVTHQVGGAADLQPQSPVRVHAHGTIADGRFSWVQSMALGAGRPRREKARALAEVVDGIALRVRAGDPVDLPVFGYYGTRRGAPSRRGAEPKRGVATRFDGYAEALQPSASTALLSEWMYRQTLEMLQEGTPLAQLGAVITAVVDCLGSQGINGFSFHVRKQRLELMRGKEVLPFDFFSDGYRNMVALVADLARRAFMLNPQHGERAARLSTGVVLIDEVELHLHPRWQRLVLGDLRRTFPRMQFIVTTHSPQVVAGLAPDAGRVLVLRAGATTPVVVPYFSGREANGILLDVFGQPERSSEVQAELDDLARLIDREEYEAATAKLAHLETRLGPDDPALTAARWTIRVETSLPAAESAE